MMTSQRHLTLIDLMAAVVAAALGMGFLMWDPPPEPTRPGRRLLAHCPACGYLVGPVARVQGHTRRGPGRGG